MKNLLPNAPLRKGIALLLATILSIVIGMVAFWRFEIGELSLQSIWADANYGFLSLALLLISSSMPFVAMRWRALFPKAQKSQGNPILLTGILSAAFVLNLALPGPVGELLSAGMVQKKTSIRFSTALAALLVSRIIGLGSACAIAAMMYWVAPFSIPEKWSIILQTAAIVLMLGSIGILGLAFFPQFFQRMYKLFSIRWLYERFSIYRKLADMLEEVLSSLSQTASRGKMAYCESTFWAIGGHIMVASGIFFAAQAIDVSVSWSAITFTYAASIAASVAMFMLPGSGVAWDILFATTLSISANIQELQAVSITLVVRLQQLLVAGLGVAVVWWIAQDLLETTPSTDEPAL